MRLHLESSGPPTGDPLVLLHGWGMDSRIWQPWLNALEAHFRVIRVDLPGLGRSEALGSQAYSLQALASLLLDAVAAEDERPALWLGWSLGGLVAAAAAEQAPGQVRGLLTLATNPCFVQRDDYQTAMAPEIFEAFQAQLRAAPAKTLNRFTMLMTQGDPSARTLARQVKGLMQTHPEGPGTALAETLALLAEDRRPLFASLRLPRLHLFAAQDALVPVAAADHAALKGCAEILPECGHLPFLSQPAPTLEALLRFRERCHD